MTISRRQSFSWLAAGMLSAAVPSKTLIERWRECEKEINGTVGAAALDLDSGRSVSLRGDEKFPLASVCKLPIAINILAMVDEGKLRRTDLIEIPIQDVVNNVSNVAQRWPAERRFKLDELIELMVARSDNTAVETLWRLGGGPGAMANRFRNWRIDGIRLDRSERECGLSAVGINTYPKWEAWTPKLYEELNAKAPATRAAMSAFIADPRDTGTPNGTVELLKRLFHGELLSASSTARLIQIMESTTTGPARLKGLLPAGTTVAHKTGTTATRQGLNGGTNDAGVVTLPNKAGRLALAVYIKGSTNSDTTRERAIARMSRAAFDVWVTSQKA